MFSLETMKERAYRLLRWSERYFKTDMLYVAKMGSWISGGQVLMTAVSFLLAIVFANFLPKETFGTYKYILSIFGILSVATLSGLDTAVIRAVAQGKEGTFLKAVRVKIQWGVWGALASILVGGYYLFVGNATLGISFFITALFVPFMETFPVYLALLQGKKDFHASTTYSAITHAIASIVMAGVVLATENLFIILTAYCASYTLLRFYFLRRAVALTHPNTIEDTETLTYGKHLSVLDLIETGAGQLDSILLWHFLGPSAVALYVFAQLPAGQLRGFFKFFRSIALPKLAITDTGVLKKTLPYKVLILVGMFSALTLAYILSAPFFFRLFFPAYESAIIYSQFFALTLLLVPKKLLSATLEAHAQKRALYIVSILNSLVQIILTVALVPFYGIAGAVAAELVLQVFSTGILFYYFRQM